MEIESKYITGRVVSVVLLCSCAEQNAENFTVGLTNVHPLAISPDMGNYNVCGLVPEGSSVKLQCESTDLQPARYVVVQLPADDRLRLCELEVYAPEGRVSYPCSCTTVRA